jgi:hypothetical protein
MQRLDVRHLRQGDGAIVINGFYAIDSPAHANQAEHLHPQQKRYQQRKRKNQTRLDGQLLEYKTRILQGTYPREIPRCNTADCPGAGNSRASGK